MDEEGAVRAAKEALELKIDAYEAIMEGLAKGMEVVSDKYEREEYFVPEILICSDAMYAAMDVLKPYIKPESVGTPAKVVIGVVEGDIHDIGKNLVRIMLEGAGFEVFDLGRDMPLKNFVSKAEEVDADIIAMSTLMSTTMRGMRGVIEILEKEGLRDKYKVMIGGAPISQSFADQIGADAYGKDASEAVRIAKRFVTEKRKT
jgi:corrinoid protein of di/trimethylamine methyltransferase